MMKNNNIENILIFIISFIMFVSTAYFLVFKLEFVYGDALSRTFHAYSVFFGNKPKLASIGFVWPPIPTLVQLPLVLIDPLNTYGFAGNITSAFFMSLTVVFLNKILKNFKLGLLTRIFFLLTFILNPMILFYGANGMSEATAIFFLVATVYLLILYLNSKHTVYLLGLGLTMSLGIMSRWEMIALIIPIILILTIAILFEFCRERFSKIEGAILLFLTPVTFSIIVWLLTNWVIMGNPLFFLTSIYSNTTQAGKLLEQSTIFNNMQGSFSAVFLYLIQRVFFLYPAYLVFGLITILKGVRDKNPLLPTGLLLLSLSILLFHFALLYKGQSFGWLRFFIYIIPFSYIFLGYLIYGIKNRYSKIILNLIIIFLIFVSSISTTYAMADQNLGREENQLVNAFLKRNTAYLNGKTYKKDVEIANYIKRSIGKRKILIDDFMGFSIIYYTQRPDLFVETIDDDFESIIANPQVHNEVGYLLVHETGGVGDFDAINRRFPDIFENGTSFTTLEKDFGEWRLYKIIDRKNI